MKIDGFLHMLLPKDKKFFPIFEKIPANLLAIAKLLNELVLSSD